MGDLCWDFFCPYCSNTIEGDCASNTDEEYEFQCENRKDLIYQCDMCFKFWLFSDACEVNLDNYYSDKEITIVATTIFREKTTEIKNGLKYNYHEDNNIISEPFKIKNVLIDKIGEYTIDNQKYNIISYYLDDWSKFKGKSRFYKGND